MVGRELDRCFRCEQRCLPSTAGSTREAAWNAEFIQDTSDGAWGKSHDVGDFVGALSLLIEVPNQRLGGGGLVGFVATERLRDEGGDPAVPQLSADAGKGPRIQIKRLTDLAGRGESGVDELYGTKAMLDLSRQRIGLEGSLPDKDGPRSELVSKPDEVIDGTSPSCLASHPAERQLFL